MDFDIGTIAGIFVAVVFGIILLTGIKIIRPTHRGAVETLGKFSGFKSSGITYVIPFVQKLYAVNITEQLVDVESQETITGDDLNCTVDAQVYYKVGEDENSLKNALYKVNNYDRQIVQLARTTLRNVIGTKSFRDVNSKRNELNKSIHEIMSKETADWGIEIVRVELKEIEPPEEVQQTMNRIIQAQNTKQAEIDFATAEETKADGMKRASIKKAEGYKQAQILEADGQAQAITTVAKARRSEIEQLAEAKANQIKLVNESAQKFFKGEAIILKNLEVTQSSLENNSKIVITDKGVTPTLVINESGQTIIPTNNKREA